MKISRIANTSWGNKGKVHLFGYDNDGKQVYQIKNYDQYFYYPQHKLEYLTFKYPELTVENINQTYPYFIDNTPMVKVICSDSSVFYNIIVDSTISKDICLSDIELSHKYILDNNLEFSKHRHIMYFDIEAEYDENDTQKALPHRAESPITSIQLYSTIYDRYIVIAWHPDKIAELNGEKFKQISSTYENSKFDTIICDGEITLLEIFVNIIKKTNVDILSGWYSANYDIPYLVERSRKIGFKIEQLSPVNKIICFKKGFDWYVEIKGLDHIDMLEAIKDLLYTLSDNKLNTAAKEILKDDKLLKLKEVTWRDWRDNFDGFIKYAIRDVELLKEIDAALKIFSNYIDVQILTSSPTVSKIFKKSNVIEAYTLKLHWNKLIFNNRKISTKVDYKGAIVLDPPYPGLHHNVAVLDYASLYPTTIMAYNLSPETYIISHVEAEEQGLDIDKDILPKLATKGIEVVDTGYSDELFGKRYLFKAHSTQVGIFPSMMRDLFLGRKAVKKDLKEFSKTNPQYDALDKRQGTYKLIMNVSYGAFGYPFYRFFKPEIADTITFFARKSMMYAWDWFKENYNFTTLYTDTDSGFFSLGNFDAKRLYDEGIISKFNTSLLENVAKKHNVGLDLAYWLVEFEHEKTLTHFYLGDRKKRYFGLQENGEIYVRGLNIIRKDTPEYMKETLTNLAIKTIKSELTLNDLLEVEATLKSIPYDILGVHKKFGRPFNQYKGKTQHLTAALWANELLGTQITHTDIPLMFYVFSKCEDHLPVIKRHSAICILSDQLDLIDKNKDKFELDYLTLIQKQVIEPLDEFGFIPLAHHTVLEYKKLYPEFFKLSNDIITRCPLCYKKHESMNSALDCFKRAKVTKIELESMINCYIRAIILDADYMIRKELPKVITLSLNSEFKYFSLYELLLNEKYSENLEFEYLRYAFFKSDIELYKKFIESRGTVAQQKNFKLIEKLSTTCNNLIELKYRLYCDKKKINPIETFQEVLLEVGAIKTW